MKKDEYDILNMSDEEIIELEKAMMECELEMDAQKHKNRRTIFSVIISVVVIGILCGLLLLLLSPQNADSPNGSPWEGTYYSGNGKYFITVKNNSVQDGESKYEYTYSSGVLTLSNGLKCRIVENNRVLYFEGTLSYKYGNGIGQSSIAVRDGYFDSTLMTYTSLKWWYSYNFYPDGTYAYIDATKAIPSREDGTYTLQDGVLIMQSGSKLNFWYIDSNYDIYASAFIKDYTEFNSPAEVDPTKQSYSLYYHAGIGGMVTGETAQSVKYGRNGSAVYAVPDNGYKFIGWSDGYTEATRTDFNITDNLSVTANFEAKQEYTVTYIAGENGSVGYNYNKEVVETVYEGGETSVVVRPDENYTFDRWSDGVTTANRADSNITSDITVTAYFKLITVKITYSATEGGYIKGKTTQSVRIHGDSSAVTAIAYYGYKFVGWSDGLGDETRAESIVYKDASFTAIFEKVDLAENAYFHRAEEHKKLRVGDACQICGLECYDIKYNGDRVLMYRRKTAQQVAQYIAEYYGENADNALNTYKDKISEIYLSAEVKTIADNAFSNYDLVQKVITDEDSRLMRIGQNAFENCGSLISIEIPNSVTRIGSCAFRGCSSITSVTIPDNVTSIEWSAFENCSSLISIEIPNSVTRIGSCAFRGCSSITSVTIPDNVTSIGWSAFENCSSLISIEIPNSVTSIEQSAFSDCSSLTSIKIPDNVMRIESHTFSGCYRLLNVTIGDSVTSIEWKAFFGCSSLKSIEIPNSVTSIEQSAFSDCRSLESITIPDSVTSIKEWAFSGCDSLICNEYDSGLYLGNSNNPYLVFLTATSTSISKCIINDNTKMIYSGAFASLSKLTAIVIPKGVTRIGSDTFFRCSSLKSIELPNSVTSIGDYAFYDCRSLESITIPDSVKSIGEGVFYGCSNLTIYCEANSMPSGWSGLWNPNSRPVVWGYKG